MDDKNASVGAQNALQATKSLKVDNDTKNGIKVAKKPRKWLKWVILGLTALVLALVGGSLVWYSVSLGRPESCCAIDPTGPGYEFTVKSGETLGDIAKSLKAQDHIRSDVAFMIYAKLHGIGSGIHAGVYKLGHQKLSVPEIIEILEAGPAVETFSIMFLPGGTLADAKKALLKAGYKEADINAALDKTYENPVLASKPAGASLEGYIYGETYEFYKDTPVEQIIERCLKELEDVIEKNDLVAKFQAQGLNLYQGIILASIVQREGGNDLPGVASVFLNRLELGMALGSDVTYMYACELRGIARDDYANCNPTFDDPYNTRVYAGLTPGAISSPGLKALLAVANPANTDYLYFIGGDDGITYFARTENEHQQNIKNHCQEGCY
jgi:UPF0755 protein